MIGTIIAAIVIGIIAGYLGRLLLPGPDPMGFVETVIVGIVGALVGWALFTYVLGIGDTDKFDLGGVLGAIVGTMLVLLAAPGRPRPRQRRHPRHAARAASDRPQASRGAGSHRHHAVALPRPLERACPRPSRARG